MRISRVAKWWFGLLGAKAALTLAEEMVDRRHRVNHFHGYSFDQVEGILRSCYSARPDVEVEANHLGDRERERYLEGLFTCAPQKFRSIFGFDRPPPNG